MAKYELNKNDIEVTEEGKVLISSEELANAIQGCDVDLTTEEEAEGNSCGIFVININ
ncbi:MAG: hypothetical protein J6M63_08810 [Pseudobutyrivibrio sp.]|uniref:hypothetical protein n=1 Tax=Pseudobutyrivibrio sp. TaxID=2014367 RepID=UPI001B140E46|nr:hypothetical protein [Pseudobutyrivibrio sp.]MBO6284012.1 hypothetical protein [Pseudobutyrivibrio sp.]MBP3263141.1 hypothetical protein [Pseudobutyrivibrio sp.]